MTSLKVILSKIAPGWWEVITRVAIISLIVGAYWYGRLDGEMRVGVQVKGLHYKIEALNAKLRDYEERDKSRQPPSDTPPISR